MQYLLVMKHLSLQKFKKQIIQLELDESKKQKLISVLIK